MLVDLINQILMVRSHLWQFGNSKKCIHSYRRLFPHVSEWEKVFLGPVTSRESVITLLMNHRRSSYGLTLSMMEEQYGYTVNIVNAGKFWVCSHLPPLQPAFYNL